MQYTVWACATLLVDMQVDRTLSPNLRRTPLFRRDRELSPIVRNETTDVKVSLTAPIGTTLESPVSSKNTTLGSPATDVCPPIGLWQSATVRQSETREFNGRLEVPKLPPGLALGLASCTAQ